MDRMKTFFKYFLMVVLFFVFSNIMTRAFLKVSYSDLKDYEINVEEFFVEVTEAKASDRDGYIYGIIKNNTDNTIENKYLKVSMLSKYGDVLGEKYVEINKIESQQRKKFEVKFDYDKVKSFRIEVTDTKPEEVDIWQMIVNNTNDYTTKLMNP